MRRTLARTRDTLDNASLPQGEETELNHRTRVTSEREDQKATLQVLSVLTTRALVVVFIARVLSFLSLDFLNVCMAPLLIVLSLMVYSRYLRNWPLAVRLVSVAACLLFWLIFAVLSAGPSALASYVLLFGPAVIFSACLSHVIAKQYAFFTTANERVRLKTMRYWRRLWYFSPRRVPEFRTYRSGFLGLILAYLVGLFVLMAAEDSAWGRHAGTIGICTFLLALPLVWLLQEELGIAPAVPLRAALGVSWKALVTWFCYNRHETQAPGVFLFPTRQVRHWIVRHGLAWTAIGLSAMAVLSVASGPRLGLPTGDKVLGQVFAPRVNPVATEVSLLPHERIFIEQLPPAKRGVYLGEIRARRVEEAERARANFRPNFSGLFPWDFLFAVIFSVLFCLSLPALILFSVLSFLTGRLLAAYYQALEAHDASEVPRQPTKEEMKAGAQMSTVWDIRIERIMNSKSALERRHLYLGTSIYGDYPVFLHDELLAKHAHILGDTGSRKTSIGIAPLLTQLIARENSSVVILDLKGDRELFHCARVESRAAGIPFKYFTNVTGASTYVFNPFQQSHVRALTVNQRTQGILQALNLEFGEEYGASYFSAMSEVVLSTYMRHYRDIGSFKDLHGYLINQNAYRAIGNLDDWKEARHLTTLVDKLAEVYPLNVKPGDLPGKPGALEEQIDLPSVLRTKQVIYFSLSSSLEPTTVSPVARLAMFALLTAAARRRKEDTNQVYVFVDEFQRIVTENVKIFLEQARSMRLAFILANQTLGQLEKRTLDLVDAVESCTAFKQSFKASDLTSLKRMELASGEALYHSLGWEALLDDAIKEAEAEDETFSVKNFKSSLFRDYPAVKVTESVGPRLERNSLIELSAKPMTSFIRFTEGSGFTQFSGYYTPIKTEYHITKDEFDKRGKADWPPENDVTVTATVDDEPRPPRNPFVSPRPKNPHGGSGPHGGGGPLPPYGPKSEVPAADIDQALEARLQDAEEALKLKPQKRPKRPDGGTPPKEPVKPVE